jgi:hypothetical protein
MKTNDNLVSNEVSNIISNFSSMVKNFGFMEKDWENKKEKFENKINDLKIDIKTNEILNMDLLKRIRMLEYAIKEEKNKNNNNDKKNNNNIQNNNNNIINNYYSFKIVIIKIKLNKKIFFIYLIIKKYFYLDNFLKIFISLFPPST